jgi:hypothetical protein
VAPIPFSYRSVSSHTTISPLPTTRVGDLLLRSKSATYRKSDAGNSYLPLPFRPSLFPVLFLPLAVGAISQSLRSNTENFFRHFSSWLLTRGEAKSALKEAGPLNHQIGKYKGRIAESMNTDVFVARALRLLLSSVEINGAYLPVSDGVCRAWIQSWPRMS